MVNYNNIIFLLRIYNIIISFIVLIVFIAPNFTSAQTEKKDSIDVLLDKFSTSKEKAEYLNNMSKEYWRTDTVKAFIYIAKSIKISSQHNLYKELGDAYRYIGNIYYEKGLGRPMKDSYSNSYEYYTLADDSLGLAKITNNLGIYYDEWVDDYDKALLYFEKSLRLKKSLNVEDEILANTYYNLGSVHMHLNSYIKSLKFFFMSLELFESLDKTEKIADVNNRIASVYLDLKEYDKAKKRINLSIQINKIDENKLQLANDYLLLGAMYISINLIDSAIVKLKKTELIFSENDDQLSLGRVYISYIDMFLKSQELDKVFMYAYLAEDIFIKSGVKIELARVYTNLGVAHYRIKEYDDAYNYLYKSLEISSNYGFLEISKRNYLYIGEVNYARHEYKEAYNNFYHYNILKDSTFNLNKAQLASEMEDKYAINKKEIELNLLAQEKQKVELERDSNKTVSNYLKLIIILVLIVLSLLFYLYYSNKRLNDRLEDLVDERTKELKESNKLLANSKKNEEDVSRIKSDLLKNISESLKTPVTEIQSLVMILKDENEDNNELYEQLELITSSTFRLNAIISSVTELYNIEDKKTVLKTDEIKIETLILSLIEDYVNQAEARDLNLSLISTNESPIWFELDRELIENALEHLLKTIIDYASKGNIEFSISDTVEEKSIVVFSSHFNINQKVFNSDLSTNSNSMKTSSKQLDRMFISLFVTKKMIEKMEGSIRWESANNGDGIKFIMTFPNT